MRQETLGYAVIVATLALLAVCLSSQPEPPKKVRPLTKQQCLSHAAELNEILAELRECDDSPRLILEVETQRDELLKLAEAE